MTLHALHKDKVLARLSRIEGQVRGIARMIDGEKPCYDTLLQVAAARAALTKVGTILLQDHIESCVVDAIEGGRGQAAIDELTDVIDRFVK